MLTVTLNNKSFGILKEKMVFHFTLERNMMLFIVLINKCYKWSELKNLKGECNEYLLLILLLLIILGSMN